MNRKVHKISGPEARAENIRLAKVENSKPGSQRERFFGSRTKDKVRITVIWH